MPMPPSAITPSICHAPRRVPTRGSSVSSAAGSAERTCANSSAGAMSSRLASPSAASNDSSAASNSGSRCCRSARMRACAAPDRSR
ncbi:hypothetical protein [Lysobacter gummosus]|uniref:hypothetical protein n=1 Tax=Lysobacter gummosus TaxID=262324 RepID=UPI00362B7E22